MESNTWKCQKLPKTQIQSWSNGQKSSFWGFKTTKIDFTSNLNGRKILKFPHCVRKTLSTSIYDFVLLYVCHFHYPHGLTFPQIWPLSRYSCLTAYTMYLGSMHPRILLKTFTLNWFNAKTFVWYAMAVNFSFFLTVCWQHRLEKWEIYYCSQCVKNWNLLFYLCNKKFRESTFLLKKLQNNWFDEISFVLVGVNLQLSTFVS